MNKTDLIKVALLGAIAIEGAVCVISIRKIAKEGFNIELSIEQADSLARSVSDAKAAALKDMEESKR